jgi:hypothetical protein
MKRKEEQLDLFGSPPKPKRKDPAPALQPRRAERTAGPTTELFDELELVPTVSRSRSV